MKFEQVFPAYCEGKKIGRENWVGSPIFTYLNKEVLLSHNDLFADDWRIFDEPKRTKKLAPCIYGYKGNPTLGLSNQLFSSLAEAQALYDIVVIWPALPDSMGFYSVEQE